MKKLTIEKPVEKAKSKKSNSTVFENEPLEGPGKILYKAEHQRICSFGPYCLLIILACLVYLYFQLFHPLFSVNNSEVLMIFPISIGIFLFDLILRSRFNKYIIYEKRIDIKKGILFRNHDSVWLYEITKISFSQNPINVLTGDAKITIEAGEQTFELTGLNAPGTTIGRTKTIKFMRDLFEELRNAVRDDRGTVKKIWI